MIGPFEPMPSGTGIAPPRCHPPPDGGTLRHVNNSLPGPVSEGSVHGNGSRQPDNWLLALAEPFVTVLAHGNGVKVYGPAARHSSAGQEYATWRPALDTDLVPMRVPVYIEFSDIFPTQRTVRPRATLGRILSRKRLSEICLQCNVQCVFSD